MAILGLQPRSLGNRSFQEAVLWDLWLHSIDEEPVKLHSNLYWRLGQRCVDELHVMKSMQSAWKDGRQLMVCASACALLA